MGVPENQSAPAESDLSRVIRTLAVVETSLPKWKAWFPNPDSEVTIPRNDLLALVRYARLGMQLELTQVLTGEIENGGECKVKSSP